MGATYQKMARDLMLKNLAEGTCREYLRCCTLFVPYHTRAPERKRYFVEAHRAAESLRKRWEAEGLRWNPSTGNPEVDALVWFRYVHADDVEGELAPAGHLGCSPRAQT